MATIILVGLSGCASLAENVVFWSRSGEIENSQQVSAAQGVNVDDDAYRLCLRRWPNISDAGLQRRALLYTLLTSQHRSLAPWESLSEREDLGLELGQIAKLRRNNGP